MRILHPLLPVFDRNGKTLFASLPDSVGYETVDTRDLPTTRRNIIMRGERRKEPNQRKKTRFRDILV